MTSQWLMLSWCTDNLESRMTVPCSWNNQRSITPCRLIKRLLRLKTWGTRDYIEAVIETAIILMIEYDCDHTLFKKSHESVKVWIPKAAQDPRRLFCSMNALMIRTNNIRKFLESGRPQSLHSGLLIDDNTTEKECNLRPAVLSTAPAIRLTWKEIDLKTYRAMKTEGSLSLSLVLLSACINIFSQIDFWSHSLRRPPSLSSQWLMNTPRRQ